MPTRSRIAFALLVVLLVGGLAITTLAAQGSNPFATMDEKLDAILAALSSAEPGPVVMSTPILPFRAVENDEDVICTVANLGSATLTVQTRIVSTAGTPQGSTATHILEPGEGDLIFLSSDLVAFSRCEWSFVGFASDVRVAAILRDADRNILAVVEGT